MIGPFLFLACGKDADTSINGGDAPDVTGHYNVILEGVVGCKDDPSWIEDWCNGPLTISGEPDALTFDFQEDMVFVGTVSASQGYNFFGDAVFQKADLSVVNSGAFTPAKGDDTKWDMSGDFEVVVSTDPNFKADDCTISGPMHATQISEL
jgi:hypothetical protein